MLRNGCGRDECRFVVEEFVMNLSENVCSGRDHDKMFDQDGIVSSD